MPGKKNRKILIMKIAIGSDHAGFKVKEALKQFLKEKGHDVIDYGTNSEQSCDYPDFALRVANDVAQNASEKGVLICGTGIGMSITANKVKGIRAALCHDELTAEMSRKHNDSNIFCAGSKTSEINKIFSMLSIWLSTPFESGRHEKRVNLIQKAEQ